jgi:hypothetical protein
MTNSLQQTRDFLKNKFVLISLFAFAALGLVGILKHEMWRDELQAWLIARDSISIRDLLANLRYESHPPLWYFLLYFITRFTVQPVFMQMAHLAIAILSAGIFLRFASFPRWQKLLFIFGYFPFYEYAVKSRNYALGICFIFIFCALFPARARKYLLLFVLVFLVAQSNFMSAAIGIGLGFLLLFEPWQNRQIAGLIKTRNLILGSLIFICTIVLVLYYAILPPDVVYAWSKGLFLKLDYNRIMDTVGHINRVFFIFPFQLVRGDNFILALVELVIICLIFFRKPLVLFLYFIGTAGLLSVFYARYGYAHHTGHLFILFIVCLWLADYFPLREYKHQLWNRLGAFGWKYRNIFIGLVLASQLMMGIRATAQDWKYPYSAAKETAQFIKDNHMADMLMLGDNDCFATSVAGYLDNQIYFVRGNRFGSFCLWDSKRNWEDIRAEDVVQGAQMLMLQYRQSVLLILSYGLDPAVMPANMKMIRSFTNGIHREESFYLYLMAY